MLRGDSMGVALVVSTLSSFSPAGTGLSVEVLSWLSLRSVGAESSIEIAPTLDFLSAESDWSTTVRSSVASASGRMELPWTFFSVEIELVSNSSCSDSAAGALTSPEVSSISSFPISGTASTVGSETDRPAVPAVPGRF